MSRAITITNVRTILTAPEVIPLVVVKVETSEPGLYGLGVRSYGKVRIPQKPGLGVEINRDALDEFVAAARKLRP